MNKLFKHTKKLVLMALTVVMMLATSMAVIAADTDYVGPMNLANLEVGTVNLKDGEVKYDKDGTRSIKKPSAAEATLYTNGLSAEMTLPGTEMNEQPMYYPEEVEFEVDALIKVADKQYIQGEFTAKSSNESVATVEVWDPAEHDGKQGITVYAGDTAGTANIKLVEKYPENPLKPKKTVTFKVTVKTLVDSITFDKNVVKEVEDIWTEEVVKVVEAGKGGSVALGTTTNKASKATLKYMIPKEYKSYISINAKGVLSAKKSTVNDENVPEGYIDVTVVAQDQNYTYDVEKNGKVSTKKVVWGKSETIRVYVNDPSVKSVKVVNVPSALNGKKEVINELYEKGTGKQSYQTIDLKTNLSSNKHTFKLQAEAYSESNWKGNVVANALTYTTSNAKIATVDANGVITAKANGTAKITIIPADGVKLTKNDVFTLTVKVTTDVDNIEIASTDVTTPTSKALTLKAKVNAGVAGKDGKIEYSIKKAEVNGVESPEFLAHITTKNKEASIKKGTFNSDMEGTLTVVAQSLADATVKKEIKITFVNYVTKINAMVTSINENNGKVNEKSKAITLYVDRAEVANVLKNDECDVRVEVTKKNVAEPIKSIEGLGFKASSNNPLIADVVENGDTYKIVAKSKGSAKITIEAQDGSKQKAVINVTVKQKVNAITVANAGAYEGETAIILAPNNKNITTATFAATVNAGASTAVEYVFEHSDVIKNMFPEKYAKILASASAGKKLTFNAEGNEAAASYIAENGKILLGTLTVRAKDGSKPDMPVAIQHVAKEVKVNVYGVAKIKYVDEIDGGLAGLVDKMSASEGLTIGTKDKIDLAALLNIPAEVTDRAVKWEVVKPHTTFLSVNAKGLATAKTKLTGPAEWAEVNVKMMTSTGQYDSVPLKIRVIASQKDFDANLSTQITTLIKENVYTWLGGKPTYNKAKATVSVAISDIEMGREQANAEMRAKLENVMNIFKDAADAVIANTSTDYTGITVVDDVTGKEWKINKVGSKVVVFVDGVQQGGAYSALDVDKAISDLAGLITLDMDDLVEWANKTLSVKLTAQNTALGYDTFNYTSNFKVTFTLKDADIEKFLDAKVAKTMEELFAANKKVAGIHSATYDANTNTTEVSIADNTLKIADVYAEVKDDAVAAMEDIFALAQKATVYVVAPGVEPYSETYTRGESSDVNNLVERLYTKLNNKLLGDTTRELEGARIYANVDFVFGTKTLTKTYVVSIARTMAAIDTIVDERVNAGLVTENEFAALTYEKSINAANVAIYNGGATFEESFVAMVDALMKDITSDASAVKATISNGDAKKEVALDTSSVTALDLFYVLNPALEVSEDMLAEELNSLVGTSATVVVDYVVNNKSSNIVSLVYTVNVGVDLACAESNIDYVLYNKVESMVESTVKLDSIIATAYFDDYENKANIYVSKTKLDSGIDENSEAKLSDLFATLLSIAKDNSGKLATITVGETSTEVALTDTIDLGIETYSELIENPITVVVEFLDGQKLTYVVEVLEIDAPGTPENPIRLGAGTFEQKFEAGQEGHYTGNLGGMTLVVTGENVSIDVVTDQDDEGNDIVDTYEAGDVIPLTGGFFNPTRFVIKNTGDVAATYTVEVAYPLGTYDNPEVIESGAVEKVFEEGNEGYYYKWTAEADGTFTFDMSYTTCGWQYVINNEAAYKYGDTHWSDDEEVVSSETWEVKAGDVLTIMVGTYDPANPWSNPAGTLEFTAIFEYPLGTELNPIMPEELEFEKEFAAGEELYYTGRFAGMSLTVTGENAYVIYEGNTYESGESVTLGGSFYAPAVWVIGNAGDTAATYSVVIAQPVGTPENPEVLETSAVYKELEAGNQNYYYTWTAEANGTFTFDISYTVDGWQYVINNTTQGKYGETHWSDDEEVVSSEVWEVKAGDVLTIMVGTYDPADPWTNPAGAVEFTAVFAYPLGTELNPIMPEELEFEKEFAAGEELYYAGRFAGMSLTVTGENAYVIYEGNTYESGESVTLGGSFYAPAVWVIGNSGDAAATYSVVIAQPVGIMDNPEDIVAGTYSKTLEAGNQCYYYDWTATEAGTMTFDISATAGGWQYVINNVEASQYGETHWSDDEEVVASEEWEVEAGDVITIMVATYDPADPWTNPAGTVNFTLSFEAAE